MILVTGKVTARPETLDDLRDACIAHSRRSRAEPGCIGHNLYIDGEDGLRLFFFERWTDRAALEAHFAVPESNAFMRTVRRLAASAKGPDIVETP